MLLACCTNKCSTTLQLPKNCYLITYSFTVAPHSMFQQLFIWYAVESVIIRSLN